MAAARKKGRRADAEAAILLGAINRRAHAAGLKLSPLTAALAVEKVRERIEKIRADAHASLDLAIDDEVRRTFERNR